MKHNATKVFTLHSALPPNIEFETEDDLPVANRQCRDVIFILLFIGFLSFLTYIILDVIYIKGSNPNIVIHGYDNYGNICGQRNVVLPKVAKSGQDMTNRTYLLIESRNNSTIRTKCVAECPDKDYYIIAFYRCLPNDSRLPLLIDTFNITRTFGEQVLSDLSLCWKEMTYLCSMSFIFAIVMLMMLRYLAGIIIWITLLVLNVASISGTAYVWLIWSYNKSLLHELPIDNKQRFVQESLTDKWFIGGLSASAFSLLFFVIVVVMRKRIQIVAMLFKEAGKAISDMPVLLLQPILTFCILFGVSLVWIYALIYLQSTRIPAIDARTGFVFYRIEPFYKYMKWYHMFAYLWVVHFIFSCQHFVIAASVSYWFYNRFKREQKCAFVYSIGILVRYHIGSVAFGSLIVASVKMLRLLFKRVQSILNRYQQTCNSAIKCCQCFLWIFEKFIIYINSNTYIEIAIYGESFCKSAHKAFTLLSNNALRLLALNSVGDFLLFLAKLCVVIATFFVAVELINEKRDLLHYYWLPIISACLFAYFVSHTFLSVYEMVTDTLFICFVEDCDRSDGIRRHQPYFTSNSGALINFVESSRKAMKEL